MNKTILILGARRLQEPAIKTAKEMGIRVVAVDPSHDAPGFAIADQSYISDLADKERCLEIALQENIDGVMTLAADYPTPMVAYIVEALEFPGLSTKAASLSTNKAEMRRVLLESRIPSPASFPVSSIVAARHALKQINGPAIFKPVIGQGGRGITRLNPDAPAELFQAAYERAMNATRGDGILVEEFVDGPEFSVEALTWNRHTEVVAVTEKSTSGHPYYVEIGHNQPPRYGQAEVQVLKNTAIKGVNALGIDWSASHSEIRLTPQGPRIMEIGARIGGGFINTHLVPLSTGVDIIKAAISLALGEQPSICKNEQKAAAIRFLFTEHAGFIKSINGTEVAENSEGVKFLELYIKPGDGVVPLVDADGRLGHVICTGTNAAIAVKNAKNALDLISIKLR